MTDYQDRLSLMIPASLRGELTPEDQAELDAAIAINPTLEKDFEFQKKLRDELQAQKTPVTNELGWARLSRSIDAIENQKTADDGVDQGVYAAPANDSSRERFWKRAAVALTLVCVAQLSLLGLNLGGSDSEVRYEPVTETSPLGQLKIALKPGLETEALTQVLQDRKGQIVSGPSALGLYTISFSSMEECSEATAFLEDISESVTSCG
ncbi:MAG: hypothetical protein AAFP97_07755 [Pseudomonadota bacterium]